MIIRKEVSDDDIVRLPTEPPSIDKRAYWNALLATTKEALEI